MAAEISGELLDLDLAVKGWWRESLPGELLGAS